MRAFLENMREYVRDMKDEQLRQLVAEVPMAELLAVWDSLDEEEELKILSLIHI